MPPDITSSHHRYPKSSESSRREASGERATRKVTTVACVGCQRRKGKCDGQRPSCYACHARGAFCVYEIADGLTRSADLKQKNQALTTRLLILEQFVDCLRSESDHESSNALARFRLGDDIQDIIIGDSTTGGMSAHLTQQQSQHQQYELASVWTSDNEDRQAWTGIVPLPLLPRLTVDGSPSPNRRDSLEKETPSPHWTSTQGTWLHPLFDMKPSVPSDEAFQTGMPGAGGTWPDPAHVASSGASATADGDTSVEGRCWDSQSYNDPESFNQDPDDQTINVVSSVFMAQNPAPMTFTGSSDSSSLWHANLALTRSIPLWAILPKHRPSLPDDDSVNSSYSDFLRRNRDGIARGLSVASIIGEMPLIECLFGAQAFASANALSQWSARMASSLFDPGIEQLVTFWNSWHLMRWMLAPSPENYAAVAPCMQPTPSQCFTAHRISADFLPTRHLRDAWIAGPDREGDATVAFTELVGGLRCNWQYAVGDALYRDGESGVIGLTPLFTDYINGIDSWSVGVKFLHLMTGSGPVEAQDQSISNAVVPDVQT